MVNYLHEETVNGVRKEIILSISKEQVIINWFIAKIYSFGSPMPGRNFIGSNTYRYGMNGQEMDNEVDAQGSTMTAEFWEYDTRIGRRWNLDPKPTVGESEYSAFLNNPLEYSDPNGDKVKFDNVKAFFKIIGHAIVNKSFRQQLILQSKATRKSEQTTVGSDGRIYTTNVEFPLVFHYKYNGQSENSLQGAANAHDAQATNDLNNNTKSSINHYYKSFSNTSETINAIGHSGTIKVATDFKYWGPNEKVSDESYKSGTITINIAGGNNDTKNDRLRLYQGSKLISGGDIVIPETKPYSTEGAVRNVVIPFNGERHAKIRAVISSDNTKSQNPGAYFINLTIRRK